jgi:DNA sulfur modification protein DndD
MRQLAAGVMPMRLIEPLLCRIQAQYSVESDFLSRDILLGYIQKRNPRLLDFLSSIDDNSPDFQEQLLQLRGFLSNEEEEIATLSADSTYLSATPESMTQVDFVQRALPHSIQEAASTLRMFNSLMPQIEATERLIATAASSEDYQRLRSRIEEAQTLVTDKASMAELKKRTREKISAELAAVERSLIDFSDTKERSQSLDEFVQSAATAKKSIRAFGQHLVLSRISTLERLVTDCLTTILHKPELVDRVKIDPKTFEVNLYDAQGASVPRHRLSAGEKQLLASALLWGLARASGKRFPVVIDTPLSRLDLSHRDNLVRDYFPSCSHQVVILSTDTELKEAQIQQLHEQGAIAREYSLTFDSDRSFTKILH